MKHKLTDFERVITGDELWFFLYYFRDSLWAASHDDLPHRIKRKGNTEKCLISILWSVNGIHCLLHVPKGTMCDTAFFTKVVIPGLIENITSRNRRKTLKGCVICMNNATSHILLFHFTLPVLILISIIDCSFCLWFSSALLILIIKCSFDFNYQLWIIYCSSWLEWSIIRHDNQY
jgi:hypothetical protein